MMSWKQSMTAALTMLALLVTVGTAKAEAPKVGQPAPAFELQDLDGNTHKLSDFQGKIVVLHFQSQYCPWDVAYQPYLNEVAQKYAKTGEGEEAVEVQFLGINANHNETVEGLKAYHEKTGMPYPILKDPGNKVADAYAAKTTPHMYVIDQNGILRYMGGVEKAPVGIDDVANMDEQYLEPVLKALIADSEPPVTTTRSKGCSIKRVS